MEGKLRLDDVVLETCCKACGAVLSPTAMIYHLGLFPDVVASALCPGLDLVEWRRLRADIWSWRKR